MRLNVQHRNIRSLDALDSWVEKQILALGHARQIDEAHIRLVRLENASPAYQVNVHPVTPISRKEPQVAKRARQRVLA